MKSVLNELGQRVGERVADWVVPEQPDRSALYGRYCHLEPLRPETHSSQLFEAYRRDTTGCNWTYLPYGPFQHREQFHAWLIEQSEKSDPMFFSVIEARSGLAAGMASFMRMAPAAGCIEIGHIHFSNQLQGTPAATEALYLMLDHIFTLGYRRCEWKCNALNDASRRAADRLGFVFEGVFRQAGVVKGRNRDTAWYSIVDIEWPALNQAFKVWLAPGNFLPDGLQKRRLSELMAESS